MALVETPLNGSKVYSCKHPGCEETSTTGAGIAAHYRSKHQDPQTAQCRFCGKAVQPVGRGAHERWCLDNPDRCVAASHRDVADAKARKRESDKKYKARKRAELKSHHEALVVDGPAAELQVLCALGGLTNIHVDDLPDALAWAEQTRALVEKLRKR